MSIFAIVAAAILAIAIAVLVQARHQGRKRRNFTIGDQGESLVSELLDRFGGMDRLDGECFGYGKKMAQIDHVVRCRDRILVIETKRWGGTFSGKEDDYHWLVKNRFGVDNRVNPLMQVARQARILQTMIPDAPIQRFVIMVGNGRHAEGDFPQGMIHVGEMSRVISPLLRNQEPVAEDIEACVDTAWTTLVNHVYASGHDQATKRYLAWVENRHTLKVWRTWLVLSLSLAVLAFIMGIVTVRAQQGLSSWGLG